MKTQLKFLMASLMASAGLSSSSTNSELYGTTLENISNQYKSYVAGMTDKTNLLVDEQVKYIKNMIADLATLEHPVDATDEVVLKASDNNARNCADAVQKYGCDRKAIAGPHKEETVSQICPATCSKCFDDNATVPAASNETVSNCTEAIEKYGCDQVIPDNSGRMAKDVCRATCNQYENYAPKYVIRNGCEKQKDYALMTHDQCKIFAKLEVNKNVSMVGSYLPDGKNCVTDQKNVVEFNLHPNPLESNAFVTVCINVEKEKQEKRKVVEIEQAIQNLEESLYEKFTKRMDREVTKEFAKQYKQDLYKRAAAQKVLGVNDVAQYPKQTEFNDKMNELNFNMIQNKSSTDFTFQNTCIDYSPEEVQQASKFNNKVTAYNCAEAVEKHTCYKKEHGGDGTGRNAMEICCATCEPIVTMDYMKQLGEKYIAALKEKYVLNDAVSYDAVSDEEAAGDGSEDGSEDSKDGAIHRLMNKE